MRPNPTILLLGGSGSAQGSTACPPSPAQHACRYPSRNRRTSLEMALPAICLSAERHVGKGLACRGASGEVWAVRAGFSSLPPGMSDTRTNPAYLTPVRYQVSISPRPLTGTIPRGSKRKSSFSRSWVTSLTWIFPISPCDSIRLAMLTVSPHRS